MTSASVVPTMRGRAVPLRHVMCVAIALSAVVGALSSCQRTLDLVGTPRAAPAMLELRLDAARGDTATIALQLASGAPMSIGSLTAAVIAPPGWRFVECAAQQSEPLLACKDAPSGNNTTVKLASAWIAGTHSGTLLTMSFVKIASTAGTDFQLTVSEMHNAIGHSLADSVGVRREIVR